MGFKEDNARFEKHIASDSMVEVVIKAHLWIEGELTRAIEFLVPHPEYLKPIDNMQFSRKVSLCGALGVIPSEDVVGLQALNAMRNKIAHNLDQEITESEINQLIGSFGPDIRSIARANPGHNWSLMK